jgi:nicotinic acid mononucleotide adenylyltransferase
MADKEDDIKSVDVADSDTNEKEKPKAKKKPAPKKDKNLDADEQLVKNSIEINPKLEEAAGKTAVVGWGRMNPITSGHEKLVNKIREVAKKEGAMAHVFLTHSQDAKKNPLSYDDKVMLARKAFGAIIQKSKSKTIIQAMQELQKKYKNVILVVGADRIAEFDKLLQRYNGKDYSFDSIKVVSAGERADPDSEEAKTMTADAMSASVMRKLASEGDFEKFKKGLPKKLVPHAQDVYDMVRGGMKIAEEMELEEGVLSFSQRRQRALTMRKYKTKIAAARKRMAKRVSTKDKLQKKARKKAIALIRSKVAGEKGKNYSSLSPSEKMMIDTKVQKRKAAIDRIAKKLLPKVRKADIARVQGKKVQESLDLQFDNFFEEIQNPPQQLPPTKRFHQVRKADGSVKLDGRFKIFRKKVDAVDESNQDAEKRLRSQHTKEREDLSREHDSEMDALKARGLRQQIRSLKKEDAELVEMIERLSVDIAESIDLEESKALDALTAKAEKSGIPFEELLSVYEEALEEDDAQWAFACVNTYIDEALKKNKDDPCWKDYVQVGTKKKNGKEVPNCVPKESVDLDAMFEETINERGDWFKVAVGKVTHRGAYKHALQTVLKIYDRKKKEGGGKSKRGLSWYSAEVAKQYNGVDARTLADMATKALNENGGAGDWGTTELKNKYKKDTPGQDINEQFESLFEEVTQKQIKDLEVFADRLLDKFGVDVEFTRHFADRMNDDRNNPAISIAELQRFFKKIAKNKAKDIKQNANSEAVLKDLQADLNLPVVIKFNRNKEEFEVVNKTIMRKKNFATSSTVIKY